jgi:hypothetical protein
MDFETVLPRLAATYENGRLVPFIGAGMSRPACTDWPGLVGKLEREAGIAPGEDLAGAADAIIIRRGNEAVRSLKAREIGSFVAALRKALVDRGGDAPAQTEALARIWWPLVLTTNYDNYFASAFTKRFPERLFAVLGRGSEDCQRLLNSLSTSGRTLLWALQGYLDAPCQPPTADPERCLGDQLVVGHDEYRRVTYRDVHFRRSFAEVFRQRSLLFLGSGIRETYLQELFGEVLELYGPSTRPHYAFLPAGEVDPGFMLARFQIVVVEYPRGGHAEVERRLARLEDEVTRPARAPIAWSWGRAEGSPDGWDGVAALDVLRAPLPRAPAEGECLAVSAGGSGSQFFFTAGIRSLMGGWGVGPEDRCTVAVAPYIGGYADRHVYAVRARSEKDERGLSHVYDAARALFEHVAARYRCIRMQLLASGGADKQGVSQAEWKVRPYPERFAFAQTVRAWGDWRRAGHQEVDCKLALHVVAEPVYREIASGRIDVLELLSCSDVRFWAEVVSENGEFERRLFQEDPKTTLGDVVRELNLSPEHWTFEVSPAPSLDDLKEPRKPISGNAARTLQNLGVVPGSTLHFRRNTSSGAGAAPS